MNRRSDETVLGMFTQIFVVFCLLSLWIVGCTSAKPVTVAESALAGKTPLRDGQKHSSSDFVERILAIAEHGNLADFEFTARALGTSLAPKTHSGVDPRFGQFVTWNYQEIPEPHHDDFRFEYWVGPDYVAHLMSDRVKLPATLLFFNIDKLTCIQPPTENAGERDSPQWRIAENQHQSQIFEGLHGIPRWSFLSKNGAKIALTIRLSRSSDCISSMTLSHN